MSRHHSFPRLQHLLLAMLLCFQLIALTQHHHDLTVQDNDCPSCNLIHHFSGGTPTLPPVLPLLVLTPIWLTPKTSTARILFTARRYLLPLPLAPPTC